MYDERWLRTKQKEIPDLPRARDTRLEVTAGRLQIGTLCTTSASIVRSGRTNTVVIDQDKVGDAAIENASAADLYYQREKEYIVP